MLHDSHFSFAHWTLEMEATHTQEAGLDLQNPFYKPSWFDM